ncbi:MAG: BrnA antitoxin family protein [Thalassospira sp.]|nr:BrnA antitoxin family protein [Thalassospira sp.]
MNRLLIIAGSDSGGEAGIKTVDQDDAPELTEEWFASGQWLVAGVPVSADVGKATFRKALAVGRPKGSGKTKSLTMRLDTDVVNSFKATGKGWQTRINAALKDWLQKNPLPPVES